jgi:hypothetical protein
MNSAFRLAALVIILTVAPAATPVAADVAADVAPGAGTSPARPELQLVGLSPTQLESVTQALALFDLAELELPPLVVSGTQSGATCGGHSGMHRAHVGWSEIELCVDGATRAEFHTVLHEVAHAWAAFSLEPSRQNDFLALRGVEVWRDHENTAWEHNGTEHAAEIIAWGVSDRAAATVRIGDVTCADLHDGYVALTGVAPSFGLTAVCANSEPVSRS